MNLPPSPSTNPDLVFLKLGGSLITDKQAPRTARESLIQQICAELAGVIQRNPGLGLVLGHGSGSYGHHSGKKHGTREGVSTPEQWEGFAEVWADAAALNALIMAGLRAAGLPALAFPPSAAVLAENRTISKWELAPIRSALEHKLIPVVYGDVVFDSRLGGTILSTEELFCHLAQALRPGHILLAGREEGVWGDYPARTQLVAEITPASYPALRGRINPSGAPDVTGGMQDKVERMLDLVSGLPGLSVSIFSGLEPARISRILAGERLGTVINS